jgi:transposase-like protein
MTFSPAIEIAPTLLSAPIELAGDWGHMLPRSANLVVERMQHSCLRDVPPVCDKAVECLIKDRDALLAFYDFPAEHWKHPRTTNVIESSFATVRHRTVRSKGFLSNKTALAMIFKLAEAAEKSWRRLDGHNQLPKVILGIKFTDGIEVVRSQVQAAAA